MDTIIRGTIAGFIGSLVHLIVGWTTYTLGVFPYLGTHYNAVFITPPGTPLTALPMFLGTVIFFLTGIFTGVIISYVLKNSGTNMAWLKGAGVGLLLLPLHAKIIPSIDPEIYAVFPLSMVLATMLFSIIYGVTAGLILQLWLWEKSPA